MRLEACRVAAWLLLDCRLHWPPVAASGQALFDHRRHRLHRSIALQILSVLPSLPPSPPLALLRPAFAFVFGSRKLPTEAEPGNVERARCDKDGDEAANGGVSILRCAFSAKIYRMKFLSPLEPD